MIINFNEIDENSDTSLTAMLDILFIMIVFFMLIIGTNIKSLEVALPSGATKEISPENLDSENILEITNKYYILNDQKFSNIKELGSTIKETTAKEKIIIATDKSVNVERLLNTLTFLKSKGIESSNILMKENE